MHFPASQIATAEPMCPSCGFNTAEGDRACVSCGYGFEFAAQLLPYEAPELRKFIDQDGHLTRDDIRRSRRALEKLRVTFPQVTVSTCIVDVPQELSLSEFGFWLFNQSVPNGPRLIERRLHTILLCIDTSTAEASLTVGYGLDPFIDDAALQRCLQKIHRPLRAENYGTAIKKLCLQLRSELMVGFAQANQAYSAHAEDLKRQNHQQRRRPTATIHDAPAQPAEHSVREAHDAPI